jgi:hypothetical protein
MKFIYLQIYCKDNYLDVLEKTLEMLALNKGLQMHSYIFVSIRMQLRYFSLIYALRITYILPPFLSIVPIDFWHLFQNIRL